MKYLLALLFALLVWALPAQAQFLPGASLFPGMQNRNVASGWFVQRGDVGWHLWFYAVDSSGNVFDIGWSCPHGVCISADQLALNVNSVVQAPDPIAAFQALWSSSISFNCTDAVLTNAQASLCQERTVLVTANFPQQLVNTTRYKAVDTSAWALTLNSTNQPVLGTQVLEQVPLGTLCDITKLRLAAAIGFYASYAPNYAVGKVVLCQPG